MRSVSKTAYAAFGGCRLDKLRWLGVILCAASFAPLTLANTLAGGADHSVIVKSDGTVWTWGGNSQGQLGDGTTNDSLVPVQTSSLTGIIAVSAGDKFSVALDGSGTVFTWGDNVAGQLADGSTTDRTTPYQVPGLSGIVGISAGPDFVLALENDGTVWSWGQNNWGQLADNSNTMRTSPVQVLDATGAGPLSGVIAIAAGGFHGLAVANDGTLWSWGRNGNGQLGNGTTSGAAQNLPTQDSGLTGLAAVAAGTSFSIALKADGTVWSWGLNDNGQLGNNSTTQQTSPVQVVGTGGTGTLGGVVMIAAGGMHSLAAKSDSSAWTWGRNANGQIGINTTATPQLTPQQVKDTAGTGTLSSVVAIAAGGAHSLAVKSASPGTAWAWGLNTSGQLGDNSVVQRNTPKQANGTGYTWMAAAPTFSPVAGTYAATQNVSISSSTPSATIRYTEGVAPLDPMSTDAVLGGGSTVAVTLPTILKGRAWASGLAPSDTSRGTFVLRPATPTFSPVAGTFGALQNVTISTATSGAAIYYTTNGSNPTTASLLYSAPVAVSTGTTLKAIAAKSGWTDSAVGSSIYIFNYGTLTAPTLTPGTGTYDGFALVSMSSIAGATIRYTMDGNDPTVASPVYTTPVLVDISMTLKAKAWHPDWTVSPTRTETYTVTVGTPTMNPNGGTFAVGPSVSVVTTTVGADIRYTTNGVDPVGTDTLVTGGAVVVDRTLTLKAKAFKTGVTSSGVRTATFTVARGATAAGFGFTVVRKTDGTVWAWGSAGLVGDGSNTERTIPTQVVNPNPPGGGFLSNIKSVAAGNYHALALATDGTVYAWGQNASGQLGDGTSTDRNRPVAVSGLTGVVAIAAGQYHSVAVKSDGSVWAWGANANGQMGIGTTSVKELAPVHVKDAAGTSFLQGITGVSAGPGFSIAVDSDGHGWGWGLNNLYQLGDGTTTQRLLPVSIQGLTGAFEVASGEGHTVALRGDGTVVAWGRNDYGQIGDGTSAIDRSTPVAVANVSGVIAIAAGGRLSVATASDGTVWTWGSNTNGQLGDGSGATFRASPAAIAGPSAVFAVGAGKALAGHALAIGSDGSVWTWGVNTTATLGDGTHVLRALPTKVAEPGFAWKPGTPTFSPDPANILSNDTAVSLATASGGATIRYSIDGSDPTTTGTVYSSPFTIPGTKTVKARTIVGATQSNLETFVYTLRASQPGMTGTPGTGITLSSLTSGASIRYTTNGSEPDGTSTLYTTPVAISTTTTLKARAFKAGYSDSIVSSNTYTLNFGNQVAPTLSPAPGTHISSASVTISPAAGTFGTIRYTLNGAPPSATSPIYTGPIDVTATTTIKAAAFHPDYTTVNPTSIVTGVYTVKVATPTFQRSAGGYAAGTTNAITEATPGATLYYTINGVAPATTDVQMTSGGSVYVGSYTLKAFATKTGCTNSDVATAVYTLSSGAVAATPTTAPNVAAGEQFSLYVKADNTVWSWGSNSYGALGDNTSTSRNSPIQVKDNAGTGFLTTVQNIAAGQYHALAVLADGTVWAWGNNGEGRLGDNSTTDRSTPTQVRGPLNVGTLGGVVAIAAGKNHSLAVKSDGSVWAWGSNSNGQLGDNTTSQSAVPVQVKGVAGTGTLGGIVAVAAGSYFSLALKSDGTVYAWGYNGEGEIGDTTITQRLTPVLVAGLTGVTSVTAKGLHALVRRADGSVWAWGHPGSGQLGNGGLVNSYRPVQSGSFTTSSSVGAGEDHSLAVLTDGGAWAWGLNNGSQLGDGTLTTRNSPVQSTGASGLSRTAGGKYHSLAVGTDGSVWAWGLNAYGQLGDGTNVDRATPVQISAAAFGAKTATPTFSPVPNSYSTPQTVTIASTTSGAAIRYTTDGNDPTPSSTLYSAPVALPSATATLKAIAIAAGKANSNVASGAYVLNVSAPGLTPSSGTYNDVKNVAVTCPTGGMTVRYTTNGVEPTNSDATLSCGANFNVASTALPLKAKGFLAGWADSSTNTATLTLKVATPTVNVAGGTYGSAQSVTISTATPSATLYYTTNGLEPTTGDSTIASGGAVSVARSMTLKVRGVRSQFVDSDTLTVSYALGLGTVATPTFSPVAGTYSSPQTVVISSATSGALIRYTLDGATPTSSSPIFVAPIAINGDTPLKAIAFKADTTPSAVATGNFTIAIAGAVAMPTIVPGGGTYATTQTVTLATSTSGAQIRYTTDGSQPTATSSLYAAALSISSGQILKARAFKAGLSDSEVRRADYWITGALVAGGSHTLALKVDGTVWSWGSNLRGQLGRSTTPTNTPGQVTGLTGVVAIAAGLNSSMALKADGTVWYWGDIGGPTTATQVVGLAGVAAVDVDGVSGDKLALKTDGTVWAWSGAGTPTQIAALSGVRAISQGATFSTALKSDGLATGTVWSWGNNQYGQLGDGTTTARSNPVAGATNVSNVTAGQYFTLYAKADGTTLGVGDAVNGQLGLGPTAGATLTPTLGKGSGAVQVVAGGYHSLFLNEAGKVLASGLGNVGQLGAGNALSKFEPWPVITLDQIASVTAGSSHSLGLRADGSVWAWGLNADGQLGDGSLTSSLSAVQLASFALASNGWMTQDSDSDGLANFREFRLGADPLDPDTNGDGVLDGAQVASGQDATNLDNDGDGVSNAVERANGSDPFRQDTDGDAVNDNVDCFPLDEARSTCLSANPSDHTPPTITLTAPNGATLISSVP